MWGNSHFHYPHATCSMKKEDFSLWGCNWAPFTYILCKINEFQCTQSYSFILQYGRGFLGLPNECCHWWQELSICYILYISAIDFSFILAQTSVKLPSIASIYGSQVLEKRHLLKLLNVPVVLKMPYCKNVSSSFLIKWYIFSGEWTMAKNILCG